MFARSLDGGETWTVQDAYEAGITGRAMDHHLGERAKLPKDLTEPIDFSHPDFALLFQRETNQRGPAHFYYTHDRGKSWAGPWKFPELDPAGITNRTDYIVEGAHAMPAMLRLSSQKWLTVIRHRERDRVWLTSYVSADDAGTWKRLDDPVSDNLNSPLDLLQLPDSRLVLAYVYRRGGGEGSSVCVRLSTDEGQSWGDEIVLRGDEGANTDVGYPRMVRRPDGKLVITYYWNHTLRKDLPRYRYIAATIWDPGGQ